MAKSRDYQEFLLTQLKDDKEAREYCCAYLDPDTDEDERRHCLDNLIAARGVTSVLESLYVGLWEES